jgi:hypothetical protein
VVDFTLRSRDGSIRRDSLDALFADQALLNDERDHIAGSYLAENTSVRAHFYVDVGSLGVAGMSCRIHLVGEDDGQIIGLAHSIEGRCKAALDAEAASRLPPNAAGSSDVAAPASPRLLVPLRTSRDFQHVRLNRHALDQLASELAHLGPVKFASKNFHSIRSVDDLVSLAKGAPIPSFEMSSGRPDRYGDDVTITFNRRGSVWVSRNSTQDLAVRAVFSAICEILDAYVSKKRRRVRRIIGLSYLTSWGIYIGFFLRALAVPLAKHKTAPAWFVVVSWAVWVLIIASSVIYNLTSLRSRTELQLGDSRQGWWREYRGEILIGVGSTIVGAVLSIVLPHI